LLAALFDSSETLHPSAQNNGPLLYGKMTCTACDFPAAPDNADQGSTYDELLQAAQANCPRCTFVLKCIRTGAAHIKVADILKVTALSHGYVKIIWSGGELSLEAFNQHGKSLSSTCIDDEESQRSFPFRYRFLLTD
jgi:hypothetical protein